MLMAFASHNTRIAIAASPAPRKIALMRNSKRTVALPPSSMRVYPEPIAVTAGDAPMTASRRGARVIPTTATTAATPSPRAIPCTAASEAASGRRSPMRRATTAATPIESPIAAVYTRVMIDSVRPTVATASGPSRETQKTSTTAKIDSIPISSTMGMASSTIPRPSDPAV